MWFAFTRAAFLKYKRGETEKRYVACITTREAQPIMASLLNAERRSRTTHNTARRTGRKAPENFVVIAAPSASPVIASSCHDGVSPPFQKRYSVSTVKTASGTSVVTRTLCASRFGEK